MKTKRAIKVIANKIMHLGGKVKCDHCYSNWFQNGCSHGDCKEEVKEYFNYILLEGGK